MELDFTTVVGALVVLVILVLLVTGRRKKEVVEEAAPEAPYKVEAPVATAPVALPVEGAGTVEVPAKPARKPRAPKVGETVAAKAKAADKKAPAKKAPAKAPAKPKAPAKKTK
jgi:hypothetical protein